MKWLLIMLTAVSVAVAGATRAETWIVGSMEGFAPFNYTVDGEYSGIDVQILNEAAAEIGVTLDHRPMPWKRALLDFDAGSLDAVFQLTPTLERFEALNLVGPLRNTSTVFVTLDNSTLLDIKTLCDLDGLVVGVVDGFTYEDAFDTRTDLSREASQDDFINMRKLLLGRSDVIVGGYATLRYVAEELNALEKLRFLPSPLTEQERYIAFHRNAEGDEMAQRLQEVLLQMHASGRILEIVRIHQSR
jgi:polar amino acid transport system substrate-binding protein